MIKTYIIIIACIFCMSSVQEAFSQSEEIPAITMCCAQCGVKNEPLFIIVKPGKDIVCRSPSEISNINPSDIITLEVLKGTKVTRKYGGKAKYGVVLLTLKEEKLKEFQKSSKRG